MTSRSLWMPQHGSRSNLTTAERIMRDGSEKEIGEILNLQKGLTDYSERKIDKAKAR